MANEEVKTTKEPRVVLSLYEAISKFQGELKPIEQSATVDFKTKAGDQVKYTYAPLSKITEAIYPILAKYGLSFRHVISEKGIECIVSHETGESISSGLLLIDQTKSDIKDVAGQITYAKRYTLGLVLGISTEEDKDAVLFDKATENLGNFALDQVKQKINDAKDPEALKTQVEFLTKELELAEALESGKGTKAPSLGLKALQYKTLLELAKNKK
jgi:hypothetical protein